MNKSLRSLFVMACTCLLISACQSVGDTRAVPESASTLELNNAQRLGKATPGTSILLTGAAGEAAQTVTVGEVYTAASGRKCRHLYSLNGESLNQVVCLSKSSGAWVIQRSLDVKTTSYSVVPGAYTNADIQQPVIEVQARYISPTEALIDSNASNSNAKATDEYALGTTEIYIENSETLWSFSQRVTGNGENMHKLAELNNIEQVQKIFETQLLSVPIALLVTTYATQAAAVGKVEQK